MTSSTGPLQRDRNLAQLLDDTVGLYRRHLWAALALAAAVVVPVELLVSGIGLGQLTASYNSGSSADSTIVFAALVSLLVTTPLVTGMLVRLALQDDSSVIPRSAMASQASEAFAQRAAATGPRRAALEGLEAFGPLVATVLLATAGIVLGLIALIVPGVYFAVRWVVIAPVVMVEGRAGSSALRRSTELVTGDAWWVLGVMAVQAIIVGIVGAVIAAPADALANGADSEAIVLVGSIIGQILGLPFSAFATTLLFFTLRARREGQTQEPVKPGFAATSGWDRPAQHTPPTPISAVEPWDKPPAAREDDEPPPGPGGWAPPVPPR